METQAVNTHIPSATATTQDTIFTDIVDTSRYEKSMKNARIWLYVIAAIQTAMGVFEYNTIPDQDTAMLAGLIDVGVALMFFGLALWSNRQPLIAFSLAFALYLIINIGLMVLDPTSISGFYIIKILVIIALWKAIQGASEIKKLRQTMGDPED